MRAEIALGQTVNITADAFPGRAFTATIATLEPQIRADTRTMMVQATLANPDEALLPGMFVNAAVVLPAEPDRVVLPETAVDYTLYGDSVYVVREDGKDAGGKPVLKAFRTPVKTGTRWADKVAILSGVSPGERGRRRGPDQAARRRPGHRHRQSAAPAAGQPDPAVTVLTTHEYTEVTVAGPRREGIPIDLIASLPHSPG